MNKEQHDVPVTPEDAAAGQEALRRDALRHAFCALDNLDRTLPTDAMFGEADAVEQAKELLQTKFEEDVCGSCEGCGKVLIAGDKGHNTSDGCTLCADCAPSWEDIKRQWDEGRDEEDDGERAGFLDAYQRHIEAGGSPDDKVLYTLA
jgi:hypothetical protein